jgi:hypothetical protein
MMQREERVGSLVKCLRALRFVAKCCCPICGEPMWDHCKKGHEEEELWEIFGHHIEEFLSGNTVK